MAAGDRLALPEGMQALVTEYGSDQRDAIDRCVVLKPQLPPLRSELRPEDVVVAVEATEVVWTDTVMATGQYQHQAKTPYSPGMTYAGRVAWMGDSARTKRLQVGDRVAIAGNAGPRTSGRYQRWGGCATYAVAPVSAVRRVPQRWSMAESACYMYAYGTAHYCIVECANLQAGETILVQGATGGVGWPAVRLAKMLGATVIAATRNPAKVDFLKKLGADHVVQVADADGKPRRFRDDVKKLTGGRGVNVVYDGVGGDEITVESMRSCCFGARFLIVGWAATPNVAKGRGQGRGQGAPNPNRVPTNLIMMKGLRIIGCPAAISTQQPGGPQMLARRIRDIEAWAADGRLPPPPIATSYELQDVKKALLSRVDSGSQVGATVVCPPPITLPTASKL